MQNQRFFEWVDTFTVRRPNLKHFQQNDCTVGISFEQEASSIDRF